MELHILDHNQRRLPYASLCLYTFAISTPVYCVRAKIASYTMHLTFAVMLINCTLGSQGNSWDFFWKGCGSTIKPIKIGGGGYFFLACFAVSEICFFCFFLFPSIFAHGRKEHGWTNFP